MPQTRAKQSLDLETLNQLKISQLRGSIKLHIMRSQAEVRGFR